MNAQNIVNLQLMGYSFQDAQRIDSRGIVSTDSDALESFADEERQRAEDREWRESCGIRSRLEEEADERDAFNDKLNMYLNEY